MFVVLGATGHTGRVVAKTLLAGGQKVRVIGRNARRLHALAEEGAEPFVADATDAPTLAKAFKDAEAAYVMLPGDATSNNYRAFQDRVSDAIAAAVQNAGVKKVVSLSSIGADKASGTGPVVGLYNLEQKLNHIEKLNVLHLRAAYFMENTLSQVEVIRTLSGVVGPIRPDLKLPMIASKDVGVAAANILLSGKIEGKQTHELLGQRDLTYIDAAVIIGKALDKTNLAYMHVPDEQLRGAMVRMGLSPNLVGLILEMAAALNSGHMKALEPRTAANSTPTSFENFVEETFVPIYNKEEVAA